MKTQKDVCPVSSMKNTDLTSAASPAVSHMYRAVGMVQTAAQRAFITVRQLFCVPSAAALSERISCCSAASAQQREQACRETLPPAASTILVVNISNSTLVDCVIGDARPAAAAAASEQRALLLQRPELQTHGWSRQQQEAQDPPVPPPPPLPPLPPPLPPNILIHGSHLNYVIIGDNNYMYVETSQPLEGD